MSLRNVDTFESGPYTPRVNPAYAASAASGGLTANDVSRIVGVSVKEGEKIKGESRITYLPYEKKVTEYEERKVVERVPVKRKIIEYEERTVVEEVPREVVATDYYAVENIKQYYKEVIPEKKIEMVPVERKIKKIEYVPVEKQIVHYPEGQDLEYAKGQSRIVLQKQGVTVRPDAVFQQIDPTLIYKYSQEHRSNPVGYVEDGYKRNLSNAPGLTSYVPIGQNYQSEGYFTGSPAPPSYLPAPLGTQNNSSSYYSTGNYASTPVAHESSYSAQDKSYATTALHQNNSVSNEPNVMSYSEQAFRNTYIAPSLNRNSSGSNLNANKVQTYSNAYSPNAYSSNAQNYIAAYNTDYSSINSSNNYGSTNNYSNNLAGYPASTTSQQNYNTTGTNYSQPNYITSASNQGGFVSNQGAYNSNYNSNNDNFAGSQRNYNADNDANKNKSSAYSSNNNNYSSYSQYASSNSYQSPQYYQQY